VDGVDLVRDPLMAAVAKEDRSADLLGCGLAGFDFVAEALEVGSQVGKDDVAGEVLDGH
jgi:hypothetical protein